MGKTRIEHRTIRMVFKSLSIKQERTLIPYREQTKVSPVIAPASCLQFPGLGEETEAESGRPSVEGTEGSQSPQYRKREPRRWHRAPPSRSHQRAPLGGKSPLRGWGSVQEGHRATERMEGAPDCSLPRTGTTASKEVTVSRAQFKENHRNAPHRLPAERDSQCQAPSHKPPDTQGGRKTRPTTWRIINQN